MGLRFSSVKAMKASLGDIPFLDTFSTGSGHKPALTALSGLHGKKPSGVRRGDTPHDTLWGAIANEGIAAVREMEHAVPGRKYRVDIAVPESMLAIEVDGWEWHGKHKGDFQRDRERQNLLTIHGWRILRFTAKDIRQDLAGCIEMVQLALKNPRLS